MYEKIKKWYEKGLWDAEMVHNAVPKLITEEQYREITQANITQEEYEFEIADALENESMH